MEQKRLYRWDECILSSAYLPPVEYFAAIASSAHTVIERCEIYQKQSYRTRCNILSANGILALSIPVKRGGNALDVQTHKIPIDSIEIDYSENWVQLHKRALEAAYMNSPFFEYYRDDIFPLIGSGETSLFKFNTALTCKLLQLCHIRADLSFTQEFIKDYSNIAGTRTIDLRERIHPKSKSASLLKELNMEKPYWQVFGAKQGFVSNLSVIDLLCNEGPDAISYLTS